jgi:hypothetical protein
MNYFCDIPPGLSLINRFSQRSLITSYRWRLKARFIAINLDFPGIFSITLSCKKKFEDIENSRRGHRLPYEEDYPPQLAIFTL